MPLSGLIVGVKDNISTQDFPTHMGVKNSQSISVGFDARVIHNLRTKGAVIGGKTICSEFAVHDRTETLNPRYLNCEPGTSSSGSAAAVAGGDISIALGTQTAGSIIKPASYCGIFGFKPTFGEIPRTGVLKTTELFDTVGFFGRRVKDIALTYNHLKVRGKNFPIHESQRSQFDGREFSSIEVITGDGVDEPSSKVKSSFENFCKTLSNELKIEVNVLEVSLSMKEIREAFEIVYAKDISYFLSEYALGVPFSPRLDRMYEFGSSISLELYNISRKKIEKWRRFFSGLPSNPLFVSLATSSSAPEIGHEDKVDANLFLTSAGSPQICLPVLRDEFGKLVGICLSGKRFSDSILLNLANYLLPSDALNQKSYEGVAS